MSARARALNGHEAGGPPICVPPLSRRGRIVLYSHDTLGFGHLRRNLLIAGALRESASRPDILMIAGMREAGAFELPQGVDCLTLPAYAKASDGTYRPRDLGESLATLAAIRSSAILAALESFKPDLMIVDNVPRGAQRELDPVLKAMRRRGRTRIVLGLRDVIDTPPVVRAQWLRQRSFEALRDFYSDVWVYGDRAFYDTIDEYGLDGEIGSKAKFVGYLDQRARLDSPAAKPARDAILGEDPRPYILCSVGGGRDGADLCRAFVRTELPPRHRGIIVTGTQMAQEIRAELRALGKNRSELLVVEFIREPVALTAGAAAIIAMGGYNTVCEVLSLDRPALIVPRAAPRAEQAIRAERLAARGLIDVLPAEALDPIALARWIRSPRSERNRARDILDFEGLRRIRERADALLAPVEQPIAVAV
jgi:predicted glycosyltransferase